MAKLSLVVMVSSACTLSTASDSGTKATTSTSAASTASSVPTASPSPTPRQPAGYTAIVEIVTGTPDGTADLPQLLLYSSHGNNVVAAQGRPEAFVAGNPRFVPGAGFSFAGQSGLTHGLFVEDAASGAPRLVRAMPNGCCPFDWLSDGSRFVYLTPDHRLLVNAAGGEAQLASLNSTATGRDGVPDDEQLVRVSADGKYVLLLDTLAGTPQSAEQSRFQVRDLEGNLVYAGVDNQPAFPNESEAVWSPVGDDVYFKDARGVEVWDAASNSVNLLIPGLSWYYPTVSPDGQLLAYTFVSGGKIAIAVYDLQKHAVVFTRSLRSHPHFVSDDTLWYLEEQSVGGAAPFTLAGTEPTGKVLAFNLSTQDAIDLPFTTPRGILYTDSRPA